MAEPGGKPRVMVDANILFAAALWPRWPYEVIQHAIQGDFQLVLLPAVIDQVRDRIAARFPAEVDRFEALLRLLSYEEAPDPAPSLVARNRGLVRDETDVPVALAAIHARVDYLVSEDKDLTARDATTAKLRARLTVMLSGTFLREVMKWTSEELERVRGRTWRDLDPPEATA
ncbi:MAG TPA: PIN domain-containing protein [Anaerolineales bacterium]|nr:PIN domain-containing protein [Anaerolineales bacterium]